MADKRMAVFGFGPGISRAVAERFGAEGFELALVSRTPSKLEQAVEELAKKNISAHAFASDLSEPGRTRALVDTIGDAMGPLTVYFWNALAASAGDPIEASVEALAADFNVGITSFLAGLKPAVQQMRGQDGAAVLLTGGGFALYDDGVDAMISQFGVHTLGAVKAAQHKLASTLSRRLADDGVFVGEVVVTRTVKGTPFDSGQGGIESSLVAEAFWQLYAARAPHSVLCP